MILHVGSMEEEQRPKCSALTPEELEDEVLIFLSDIINDIDPSLCFDQVQTDAYNKLYCTVAIGPPDEVLSCDKALEVSVTRCSLKTLIEEAPYKKLTAKSHVNDEVINSYMALIRHRSTLYPAQLPKYSLSAHSSLKASATAATIESSGGPEGKTSSNTT